MTVNDSTYFISDHKQFENASELHKNTFQFLRLNTTYRYKTYSDDEIRYHLENKLPDVATHATGETNPTASHGGAEGEDNLATASFMAAT